MQNGTGDTLYRSLIKALSYTVGLVILLWFLYKITGIVLLLLFAIVLALIINAPVARLEKKKMKRGWACLVVFGAIILVVGALGWLIVPKITSQLTMLVNNLPAYAEQLSKNAASWFTSYPEISKEIKSGGISLSQVLPSLPRTLISVGNYSLSLLGSILIFIVFISMVVYAVTNPRPLLEIYFSLFAPAQREKARNALFNTSTMLNGWIRSNLIGGTIEAVCVTAFLSIMNVPGAWVWGAITFFAELIPKIGFYIMAVPPILVALSVSPATALWVTIFFLALDEIMGDFVMPKIRSNTMKLHPVSTMFILLAMGSAFGLTGALLATPMTAIIKAFYEEFYLTRFKEDTQMANRIDDIIYHKKETKG